MEIKAKINKWDLIKLKSFHVLAIINSAVMNIGVHVSLSILVSLVCMPKQWDCWVIRQFYRCPSADEWIRKLWYIYTMEFYSAI